MIETGDLVTSITSVGADIVSIGTAIIGLAVLALGITWIKATFF